MGGTGGELADDLRSREIGDFHPGQTRDRAAIVPRAASLHELEASARKERGSAFLQPALRRDGENEGLLGDHDFRSHQSLPPFGSRSIVIAAPTAGTSSLAPRRRASPS